MKHQFKLIRLFDTPAIMTIPKRRLEGDEIVSEKEWTLDLAIVNPTLAKQPHFEDGIYIFMLCKNTGLNALIRPSDGVSRYIGANDDLYDPTRFSAESKDELENAIYSFFPYPNASGVAPFVAQAVNDRDYSLQDFWRFLSDEHTPDSEQWCQDHVDDVEDNADAAIATMLYGMYEDGGNE